MFYTNLMSVFNNPEFSLRITIFFSSLIFLFSMAKLGENAWIFVLFIFLVDSSIGTQMYFNQIRQGMAMSVFLLFSMMNGRLVLASILAALLHASFLVAVPCAIAAVLAKKDRIYFYISIVLVGVGLIVTAIYLGDIDFGRRADTYELVGKLNWKYYFVATIQYGVVFFLLYRGSKSHQDKLWYRFTVLFVLLSLGFSVLHEAGGRLLYLSSVFVPLILARNLMKKNVFLAACIWVTIILSQGLHTTLKLDNYEDTILGRWELILMR